MDSAVRVQPSWSDLQPDLLTSIGTLLDAVSFLRCSAVCSSWAAALRPNRPNLPPIRRTNPLPLLLLSAQNLETNPNNTHFTFYDLSTNTGFQTVVRSLIGQRWIGSDSGWLVTVGQFCEMPLVKPLYGDCFILPDVTTIPLLRGHLFGDYDLNGSLVGYCGMDLKRFSRCFFKKVIICKTPDYNDGFLIVGLFARFHLAMVKSGDEKWSLLDDLKRIYHDAILFDGKLYAITGNCLHCWDLDRFSFGPCRKVCHIGRNLDGWTKYLVELKGELLMVCRTGEFLRSTVENYKTVDVRVYKFTLNPNSFQRVVNGLEDVAIFLGTSNSKAISSLGLEGVQGNCVYFTDDAWWSFINPNGACFNRDLGVFDLGENTYSKLCTSDEKLVNWPPPTWFWPF